TRLKRTVKSCGSDVAVLALRPGEAKLLWDNGGKRAVLREEHEVSRKAIAQGRPECSSCPVCSCAVLFAQIARETAGAASTRSSLRPLNKRAEVLSKPRAQCAARMRNHICVGWVERSETHHLLRRHRWVSLRSTHPTGLHDVETWGHQTAVSKVEATCRTVVCQTPGTPITARSASISGSGISLW